MNTTLPAVQSLTRLQASNFDISIPFQIALPDGSELSCTDMLRCLPGKRLVMRAMHQGSVVLAKLFFDERNLQKEINGYSLLHMTGIATPTLLAEYRIAQGGICLYRFIDNATPLDTLWQQTSDARKSSLFDQILAALQPCYQQQILQQDLHLGNFLLQDEALFMLDPASCSHFSNPAAKQENLALLLAQLPFADWQLALDKISGIDALINKSDLATQAKKLWQHRKYHYLKKIFRDCSDVADLSLGNLRILCRRHLLTDTLAARLRDPQSLLTHATVLKNGNSAKVFLTEIEGKKLVIKQYINKDWLRKIRRAFRQSRASRSWYFSHALRFAGIDVPTPVALIEQKTGPLVTSAWFIAEYSGGKDLLSCWQEREPSVEELSCIYSLFLALQIVSISHGDLKATNLISDGQRVLLIDYDSTQEHGSANTLLQALHRDKQRFLQNWAGDTVLQEKLAELIKT